MIKSCIIFFAFCFPFLVQAQLFAPKHSFTHADTLRGSITPLRSCYDINFYHLDVKFDIDQKMISGSNQFKFTATQNFTRLQFDLFTNFTIEKVLYHGRALVFKREYNAVFVTFPDEIRKGNKDEFTVYYSGHPAVATKAPMESGVVFAKDSLGNLFVATACESKGASIWWPNKDHLSDEVDSMLISISVPNDLKEVSNGRLRKVTDLKNGYSRYDWFVSSPINNYNVAVNIAKYTHFQDTYSGEGGKLTLDYWVLPYNLARAKSDFGRNVKPMLASYEHWFGPYPFYKDGYKLVETPYPAMEHQSAISYGGYLRGGPKNELGGVPGGTKWDFVIVHESAHEWFGNSITAKDLADLWIHEAFANYAESLFLESQYGKKVGQDYIYHNRAGIANESPIVAAYHVNQLGSGDMYSKGSVLLNTIRTVIDDDSKWRSILRGLNQKFYHQTVTYDQIVNYMNTKSGMNLKPIFDQYLLHKELPVLVVKSMDGKLFARWNAADKNFKLPVVVKNPRGKAEVIYISTGFSPINVLGATKELVVFDDYNFYFVLDKR